VECEVLIKLLKLLEKEKTMSVWREESYKQAVGVSLGIHGLIFGMFLWLGQAAVVHQAAEAKPSVVEIVPSWVLEMGKLDCGAGEDSLAAASSVSQEPPRVSVKERVSDVFDDQKSPKAAVAEAIAPDKPAEAVNASAAALPEILQGTSPDQPLSSRTTVMENEPAGFGEAQAETIGEGDSSDHGICDTRAEQNDCVGADEVIDNPLSKAGERVMEGGEASNLRKGAAPRYPAAARKAGWEGLVVARVLVDTRGCAAAVSIRKSSGYSLLDQAVTKAVKKWIFTPATQAGKPIVSFHDVKVRFRLADQR
jgi:TonB family protein